MPSYPVSKPSISGTDVTVDLYSKQPLILARTIQQMRQNDYWLSDLLFSSGGTAESGSLIYYPVTAIDDQFVASTADIEDVGPGDEFPVVSVSNIGAVSATAQKRGAKMKITKEMKTRNQISRFRNQVQAMYNTTKRKADAKAIAAVNAASFLSQAESATWATTSTKIRSDILTARHTLENSQLGKTEGYMVNTMVLGSNQWQNIVLNDALMDSFYKANVNAANLLNMGMLDGLLGIERVRLNPWIGANERWLFDGNRAGTKVEEYPLALENWYDPNRQVDWFQLSESDIYAIEAPKSIIKIV
jgi:hypothetical protein